MKNILTLLAVTFLVSIASFATEKENPSKENNGRIMIYRIADESSIISNSKTKVLVQEIEEDEVLEREVEISSINFSDDNFIYVEKKEDLNGFALQLAAFNELSKAKEYALGIAKKGDAEKRELFIYTLKVGEKTWYRVYYGLMRTDANARDKQRSFSNLGYSALVKEFK